MEQKVEYEVEGRSRNGCLAGGLAFSSPEAAAGLSKRLAKAMLDITSIEKRGHNAHFNYDFVTSEDIKWVARKALAKHEIGVIPTMVDANVTPAGKQMLTRVHWEFLLTCPEGYAIAPWESEALDSQDKGLTKASTSGLKYFLISLLQIPTGDEPDPDSETPTNGDKSEKAEPEVVVVSSTPFPSPEAAITWGFDQGAFKAKIHAKNAYLKLKDEMQPTTASEMAELWKADVARRLAERISGDGE